MSKKKSVSLRKGMATLGEFEIKLIQKNAKKYLNKLNRKFIKNWHKNLRMMITSDKGDRVWTLVVYNVQAKELYSSVSLVHESDKDVISLYIANRICWSRMAANMHFLMGVTEDAPTTIGKNHNTLGFFCDTGSLINTNITNVPRV